jgi:hypothetical protein
LILFLCNENEFDPVRDTVKNPILPDPVIPPVNSEFKEPVTDESVIKACP